MNESEETRVTVAEKRARMRQLIESDQIALMPGVYDGFSLRLVEQAGYESALITGSGVSESRLGVPDVGVMGPDLNIQATEALCSRASIPLLADGDTGYGNAVNVHFVVRAFERAGAAGVMFEDQVWPKRCGHPAGKQVIDAAEMVAKIRAAVDARESADFLIKARTDAAGVIGIDEAIRRAHMYAEAGADLIFADALLSTGDIERFVSEVSAPVAINMGFGIRSRPTTPLVSPSVLEEIGVAVVEYPRMLTAAAVQGMLHALGAFAEARDQREPLERPDLLVSFDELCNLMGLPEIHALEQRYLSAEQLASKYGAPTATPA
jgi:2-methylisocitrate lyase-like PEP mutase family enzyme